jgi:trehalose synthase
MVNDGKHDDAPWYKDAIIYQIHVRAFADSDADGIGDFEGLTSKLDYVHELGATAIWLLPFYPSPLRDDGYDIADYTDVNTAYGDLRSFRRFLKEAHRRGLRVITELVMNHTSDAHPWFQRARRAGPQSRWRNFYVWSDDPSRFPEARVIFQDFESSNWTWDNVAQAYYWHRFYSHQPDLNFDNPEVRRSMMRALDFWLEAGVDGVRLDAVPYLFERDGTNCENLPETHEFLRELRAHVDKQFGDRMLLAEANQWPEDAVEYFGNGDECHMAFHFPVMPRLFMALQMEHRLPIIDILEQTPAIPENAQWAMFLRNHDELTLEMVTDEERDYMYRRYADDPRMRVNLGIRRRLAPLLQNDRRKIELLNGLLFSLPGAPIVYYGDEIGMGDNVYLGDRDSVRTPMQWNGDRNAGFSRSNPQQLYLPVVIDPEYHYEALNVEAQQRNSSSLWWWMRRLIALRKMHPVLARGDISFLDPDNPKVLAFLRRLPGEDDREGETVLVVANLSRHAQQVELDLRRFDGARPIELFGHTTFSRPHRALRPHDLLERHPAPLHAHARTARLPLVPDRVRGGQRHAGAGADPQRPRRSRDRVARRDAPSVDGRSAHLRLAPALVRGESATGAGRVDRRRHPDRATPPPPRLGDAPEPRVHGGRARAVRRAGGREQATAAWRRRGLRRRAGRRHRAARFVDRRLPLRRVHGRGARRRAVRPRSPRWLRRRRGRSAGRRSVTGPQEHRPRRVDARRDPHAGCRAEQHVDPRR